MRKHMNVLAVLGVLAFAAVPAVASAATFGGEVFGAFNSYNMSDVNDALNASNQASTSPSNFDEISSGITGGLSLRLWANPNWMFAAGWEPLFAETESSVTDEKWDVGANSFQLTGGYFFPSATSAKYGIGAGLGHYSLNGERSDSTPPAEDVKGSGVGFHFMGMGEWTVSPGFAITGGAGYRVADITVDDTPPGSPEQTVDYSGFMGRVGLAFYMPSSSN